MRDWKLPCLNVGDRVWVWAPDKSRKATITALHHQRPPHAISIRTLGLNRGNFDYMLRFDGETGPAPRVFASDDLSPVSPVELLAEGIANEPDRL